MASNHYRNDLEVLAQDLVEALRQAMPRSGAVTFRRDGASTASEQRLPLDLVAAVRAALPWDGDAVSMVVYVARPRDEAQVRAIEALAGQHSSRALATALGCSPDTVYAHGGAAARTRGTRPLVSQDAATLIAGLAAIRRRDRIDQRWIATAMGCSPATLSSMEAREPEDADQADRYLRALAQAMRIGLAHLRRQALEVGAALRAVRQLPAPQ